MLRLNELKWARRFRKLMESGRSPAPQPSRIGRADSDDQIVQAMTENGKARPLRDGFRTHKIGGGWGNSINWGHDGNVWMFPCPIHGWKTPPIETGDALEIAMESGRTLIGSIEVTRYCSDPRDMFFAEVHWLKMRDPAAAPPSSHGRGA